MLLSRAREDLRVVKTGKALSIAMLELLRQKNFTKIRVKDICDRAQISRAAFYAHFVDKYDFLRYWLLQIKPVYIGAGPVTYERIQSGVNRLFERHMPIIKNIVFDADHETLGILGGVILQAMERPDMQVNIGKAEELRDIVLSSFYAGGMIQYLVWLTNHKLPADTAPVNEHLYGIVTHMQAWEGSGK